MSRIENKEYFRWNYRKWFWLVGATILVELLGICVLLIKTKSGFPTGETDDYIIFFVSIILMGVLYTVVLAKAMLAMERINNDSRYLPTRTQHMTSDENHLFTGKHIRTNTVYLPVRLLYPLAVLVFSLEFHKNFRQDVKLQRKCKTKEKYKEIRKRTVKKTIEDIRQELGMFEVLSIMFLLPYVVLWFIGIYEVFV